MRCGIVRLVTRRSPYEIKIRKKAWTQGQRGAESCALNNVAESKVIGRFCAHKICRLVEKSSKLVCKVLSDQNVNCRRFLSTTSPLFERLNDANLKSIRIRECNTFTRNNLTVKVSRSKLNSPGAARSQTSKIVLRLQNYSAKDKDFSAAAKPKISRPFHALSKCKFTPYKRFSAQRVASRKSGVAPHKNYKRYLKCSSMRNKTVPPRKLYVVQSPFVTYPPELKEDKYINRLRHRVDSPFDGLDKSDFGQGFLDRNVLNHLNETSYLSLCGCETCDRKLKAYEKKNNKINLMLQNKISKILNYCKEKNPFYKIYSQCEKTEEESESLNKYAKNGVNGWLNYLDACECADWKQYRTQDENRFSSSPGKNKGVNTSLEAQPRVETDCDKTCQTVPLWSRAPVHDATQQCHIRHDAKQPSDQLSTTSAQVCEPVHCNQNMNQEDKQTPTADRETDRSFQHKDNSTTQTKDFSDNQVKNYYYITNNTLNTKCCCKEEFFNESWFEQCNKFGHHQCKNETEQPKPHDEDWRQTARHHKSDGQVQSDDKRLSSFAKTLNKVYDVVMKPLNETNKFKMRENTADPDVDRDKFDGRIKADNLNNFEYFDCESYRHCNMVYDPFEFDDKNQVSNFDEFMDLKFRELKKNTLDNGLRFLDEMRLRDAKAVRTRQTSDRLEDRCQPRTTSNDDARSPRVTNIKNLAQSAYKTAYLDRNKPEDFKPVERLPETKPFNKRKSPEINENKRQVKNDCDENFLRPELGPLDHLNQFIADNRQRYEEKLQLLSKGPNFSHFPDSKWRTSLLRNNKQLSETFDVSDPHVGDLPIKISTAKTRDLSKYSEINIAIEKVKKKIHNIIYESDDKVDNWKHAKPGQRNKGVISFRQDFRKRTASLVHRPNYCNIDPQLDKENYNSVTENNRGEKKVVKMRDDGPSKGQCDETYGPFSYSPSSVHLNEIIEAIKENKNVDKCDGGVETYTERKGSPAGYKGSSGYKVYGGPLIRRQTPFRHNAFGVSPGAEPLFGLVNAGNVLGGTDLPRQMSTSSKKKPFLGNADTKTNKKVSRSKFMQGTIFSTDNLVSEGWDNENTIKALKKKSYFKYMENRVRQIYPDYRVFEQSTSGQTAGERKFLNVEYVDNQSDCQEELFNKSINVFSKSNQGAEGIKRTEYSPRRAIAGVVERYSTKATDNREKFNRDEDNFNEIKEIQWKIWDSKEWENRTKNSRAGMMSKGFGETKTDDAKYGGPESKEIIFNEHLRVREGGGGDGKNWAGGEGGTRNEAEKRCKHSDFGPPGPSAADNTGCVNVGDLGLNFTSFALENPDEKEKRKRRGATGLSALDSQSGLNNAKTARRSGRDDLQSHRTRNVGLRTCNKSEVPVNSFGIRNSYLMDAEKSLRPLTSTTVNKRLASSGPLDDANLKSIMAEKLRNLERIDQVNYTREEKCVLEKEAVETTKLKESYMAPVNKTNNTLDIGGSSENGNAADLGVCSKEVERKRELKAVGESDLTNQITEEMKVCGLFPDGKKCFHGKVVSVLGKPKNNFTLKVRNKGLEVINPPNYKKPITVHMLYETTTDHSVSEHIDKAKRKVYIGDIRRKVRPPKKPVANSDKDWNQENNRKDEPEKTDKTPSKFIKYYEVDENMENGLDENKSKVWKKYSPRNTEPESKKNILETIKMNKQNNIGKESIIEGEKRKCDGVLVWKAPTNRLFDKVISPTRRENECTFDKTTNSPQTKVNCVYGEREPNIKHTTDASNDVANRFVTKCMSDDGIKKKSTIGIDIENLLDLKKDNFQESVKNVGQTNVIQSQEENKCEGKGKNIALAEPEGPLESKWNPSECLDTTLQATDDAGIMKSVGKVDKPTSGETKYEIDSDSVADGSRTPVENEKLVITHFKEFRRPEETRNSGEPNSQSNVILEASMLKVTFVHERNADKNTDTNIVEVQSIESLSNQVEQELNDLVSPYIKDLIATNESNEINKTGINKTLVKPKEFFLNMTKPENYKPDASRKGTVNAKQFGTKEEATEQRTDNNEELLENNFSLKIGSIKDLNKVQNDRSDANTDLAHVLRSSIEKLYMKQVDFVTPFGRNDLAHQMRSSMEKLYTKQQTSWSDDKVVEDPEEGQGNDEALKSKQPSKKASRKETNSAQRSETQGFREPTRYDSIVRELKKMFVRKENSSVPNDTRQPAHRNESSTNLNRRAGSEYLNDYSEQLEKSERHKSLHRDSETVSQVEQDIIKKDLETSTEDGGRESILSAPGDTAASNEIDPSEKTKVTERNIPIKSKSTDNTIKKKPNLKDKFYNKSFYSYDSALKPRYFDLRKKKKSQDSSSNINGIKKSNYGQIDSEKAKLGHENETLFKTKIPVSKHKSTASGKQSPTLFYSYDSSMKPGVARGKKPSVEPRNEETEKNTTDKEKAFPDDTETPHLATNIEDAQIKTATPEKHDTHETEVKELAESESNEPGTSATSSYATQKPKSGVIVAEALEQDPTSKSAESERNVEAKDDIAEPSQTGVVASDLEISSKETAESQRHIEEERKITSRSMEYEDIHKALLEMKKLAPEQDVSTRRSEKDASTRRSEKDEPSDEIADEIKEPTSKQGTEPDGLEENKAAEARVEVETKPDVKVDVSREIADRIEAEAKSEHVVDDLKVSSLVSSSRESLGRSQSVDESEKYHAKKPADDEKRKSEIILETRETTEEILPRLYVESTKPLKDDKNGIKKRSSTVTKAIDKFKKQSKEKLDYSTEGEEREDKTDLKQTYSKYIVSKGAEESEEKYEFEDSNEKTTKTSKRKTEDDNIVASDSNVISPKERKNILASSLSQYEAREDEEKYGITDTDSRRGEVVEASEPERPREARKNLETSTKRQVAPPQEPLDYVPPDREKSQQELAIEAWEKEPTYLKNLRPSFYKMKRQDLRNRNYDENEKRFKSLQTLNKIASMNKVSECSCDKKEKWVADMCCSQEASRPKHEETNEQSTSSDEANKQPKAKSTILRSGRGYRSSDWPDNLSRRKDAVIKQPLTPRPPWRN